MEWDPQGGASGKESACYCRRHKRRRSDPWVGKIPLEKEMATHSSIHAWRIPWTESLEGYSPWGHKESDTTEWLTLSIPNLFLLTGLLAQWIGPWVTHSPKTKIWGDLNFLILPRLPQPMEHWVLIWLLPFALVRWGCYLTKYCRWGV